MRAAYGRIYQDLKRQIEDGTYGYGGLLPSQTQLVARYGVAHNTARKALAQLTSEGYCLPIHGKGVRVIWRPSNDEARLMTGGIEDFTEEAERNKVRAQTRVTIFETLVCDESLTRLTGFDVGERLLHIERLHGLDNQWLIHDTSYYLAESVDGLTRERAAGSIYGYVEDRLGAKIATGKRTVTVRPAGEAEARELDLGGCEYLVVIETQVYDGNGYLFEYTQSRRHPSCFCLREIAKRER